MRPATSLGPPAANGTTSVSGRVGQFCADAVPGAASSASIAANAERHAPITRLLPMPMVRPCSWPRGVLERAGRALSPRRATRAIVRLTLLRLRGPLPPRVPPAITSIRALFDTAQRCAAEHTLTARHVGVARSIVNNNPETSERGRRSLPTAAGWCVVLMKDRRPGRRQRNGRRAGTHNQRPWLWVPSISAFTRVFDALCAWTTRVGFVGFVSPKCAATAPALLLTMSNSPSRSRGAFLRPGFATSLRQPESRGGRSAERRLGARRNTH